MNSIRICLIGCFVFFFLSCKTKNVNQGDKYSYEQALQILDDRCFKFEFSEYYDKTGDHNVEYPLDSYLSVRKNEAVVRFSNDINLGRSIGSSYIEDHSSELTNIRTNKKGDIVFDLKVDGGNSWLQHEFEITLIKNSMKCFVRLMDKKGEEYAVFWGIFVPL